VLLVIAAVGACASDGESSGSSTVVIAATTSTTMTSTTTGEATTSSSTAAPSLPLDDLAETRSRIDTFLAGSPGRSAIAEELAAQNRRALEIARSLDGYDDSDRAVLDERLVELEAIRRSLADRLTQRELELIADLELGPELDPGEITQLPSRGLAVGLPGATVLIDLDGNVLGHLEGYSIDYSSELPGPIMLQDALGAFFVLAPGATALVPSGGAIPLAYGAAYVVETTTARPDSPDDYVRSLGGDGWSRRFDGELLLSAGREFATIRERVEQDGDLGRGESTAIDLSSGSESTLPEGCWIGAASGVTRYLVCDRLGSDGYAHQQISALEPGTGERLIGSAPDADYEVPSGRWRWLLPSPDGNQLLGQWSGECEIPTAFFIPTDGSSQINAVGGTFNEDAPASYALGWSGSGDAFVSFAGDTGCGQPAVERGIHRYDASGDSEWLYDTGDVGADVRMWQPLPQHVCAGGDYTIEFLAEPATAQLAIGVNVFSETDAVCELDLTGTLTIVDGRGNPAPVTGSPAAVRLVGFPSSGAEQTAPVASQMWVWQDWCGDDVFIRLDLDDGFSAQLEGAPRCNETASESSLRPLALDS
jgi:hypothetical protein